MLGEEGPLASRVGFSPGGKSLIAALSGSWVPETCVIGLFLQRLKMNLLYWNGLTNHLSTWTLKLRSPKQRGSSPKPGLPWRLSGKQSACWCRRHGFNPWVGKIPWKRKWQPTPVFLLGESHGQRSLAGYGPWGRKRVGHTEWLNNNSPKQINKPNWIEKTEWDLRIYWNLVYDRNELSCFRKEAKFLKQTQLAICVEKKIRPVDLR